MEASARTDVHQQRIVKGVAAHIGDQADEVEPEHQTGVAAPGEAERDGGENPGAHENAEIFFAAGVGVGDGAEPRGENPGGDSGGGADESPVTGGDSRGEVFRRVVLEENRSEDGPYDQRESRIGHIVQNPAQLGA